MEQLEEIEQLKNNGTTWRIIEQLNNNGTTWRIMEQLKQ